MGKPEKMVRLTSFIRSDQKQELDRLHEITRVPVAEYVREAIDMVLKKYKKK